MGDNMPKRLLTDRFCATAKSRDGELQTDYFDTQVSGLALRVSEKGYRSWTLHFTQGDKRRRLTFGTYPALSLGAARTRADEARASIAEGHDPNISGSETLRDICELYLAREGAKLRTAQWRKRLLDRHVYPTLGSRPIADIRRSEIVGLLDRIEEGTGPIMATQTLALVRKIMNWHAARSDDFNSPIVRGMARIQSSEIARDRILTDDELRKVWQTNTGVFSDYVRFILLTAARRNEASEMEWTELDGSDWTLPASRNKTKLDLVRPLSRAAMQLLATLPRSGSYVFSSDGVGPFTSFSNAKATLDGASGTKGWTLHDCRRTARSLMSRAGVPTDHAERCLGHVIGGVRGVYDRHEYHAEKARAFEMLAGEIERIVSGGSAKVVTMRGKRTNV
jgi:integrase